MTILKQTTCFHLNEKDFEIANVYADLYSQMIIQYINMKNQAVASLKDLALEFYNQELYRNAEKYFLLIQHHYGEDAFNAEDYLIFGEIEEKLNHVSSAMASYQHIVRRFKNSAYVKEAYQHLIRLYSLCNNRSKAEEVRNLYAMAKHKRQSYKRTSFKKIAVNKKKV